MGMVNKKVTIEKGLLSLIIDKVHEDGNPIAITTGKKSTDFNGDTQVDVLFEFEEGDKLIFNQVLNECINQYNNIPARR
jgi:hypothetical protein